MMPAPAAVKGSAYGPLRALDGFDRGQPLRIMTGVARVVPEAVARSYA